LFNRTKVRIYSEVWLPADPKSLYNPVSLVVHECVGQVLDCSTWTCRNDEAILARNLCDGKMDCTDNSDEDPDLCKGDTGMVRLISTVKFGYNKLFGSGQICSLKPRLCNSQEIYSLTQIEPNQYIFIYFCSL